MSTTLAIPAITDDSFATEVAAPGTGLVALEFSAPWCGACKMLAPTLHAVAQEYAGHVRVLQIDTDANPATMARYGVRGLPTTIVFRDGEPVDHIIGAVSGSALRERFDRLVRA